MQRPIPPLIGGRDTYGLVEQMEFFFVRIIKAKNLPPNDITTGSCNPYVEVRHGNYRGTTSHFEQRSNPEWNQVFVFPRDQTRASTIEVVVKDRYAVNDDFIGMVEINDLNHIPRLVGPDSALAPRLCRLENQRRDKVNGELSLTVWIGTQRDEAFREARHLDAETVSGDSLVNTGSQVYHSPKLWYLRLNVIEARVVQVDVKAGYPEVFVRARLGNQVIRTKISKSGDTNPVWKEELMFVAAEPFEEPLVISVEERLGPAEDKVLGKTGIDVQNNAKRRLGNEEVSSGWYDLQNHVVMEGDQKKNEEKCTGRISLGLILDGGYHVFDEATHYCSDPRPSDERLWKPSIGILELDILGAQQLQQMKSRDGRETTDAYCVAKYGGEWVRTRTVMDSITPEWNERHTWRVYDPQTVITVGVFDNCHLQLEEGGTVAGQKDNRIGKVRIRLSTLENGRDYTHSYLLLVLLPSGLKKMGEIRLNVRFTCSSMLRMMHTYTQPWLPKLHYLRPLFIMQLDLLRHNAIQIISPRLSSEEPPLKKEVVEYMTDVDSHTWSMRRSKANFFRIMAVWSSFIGPITWFDKICNWKNPSTTVLIHLVFVILVLYPELILPAIFLYLFLVSVWNRRYWPGYPPHIDTRLSHAETIHPDELDEEFDAFPTSRPPEIVKMRYDRLRTVAGRIQAVTGDLATQGERLQLLSSGRDPRATNLFSVFCLLLAIILYFRPRIVALLTGFYVMRHPRFRHGLPSVPLNFFGRLPSRADTLL